MTRARSGKTVTKGRKRLLKLTKGFVMSRHNLVRQSLVTLMRGGVYAFRDRKARKREFRRLWIIRINAACRAQGARYGEFISGLERERIALNRKMLAEIAVHDPGTFTKILQLALPSKG